MSIQTDLTRIKNAKATIKAYIEGNGLTVPDATLLDGMASMLESIQAGGGDFDFSKLSASVKGSVSFSFTPASAGAGTRINIPEGTIPRFGFGYANDISYAYNKSIGFFWMYSADDPCTDVSDSIAIQAHIYTNSTTSQFFRSYYNSKIPTSGSQGCMHFVKRTSVVEIVSQTLSNNEAKFSAGVTYYGVVMYG